MYREPTNEEHGVLTTANSHKQSFFLVPVKYRGEFRYALAVKSTLPNVEAPTFQVLAICVDATLDEGLFSSPEQNLLELN